MRYVLFGLDRNAPEACADDLAARGFSAVVCPPDARSIRAVRGAGMRAYACFGAFSYREGDAKCIDVDGCERLWFSSGCPNDPVAQKRREAALRSLAEAEGLSGVLIDGARFASPASQEGIASLFTCFCPECRRKMADLGLDPDAVRAEVAAFRAGEQPLPPGEWLAFRADTVRAAMRRFTEIVKGVNPAQKAGAFVFPPSLGALVGQTPQALEFLDVVSPMLYRRYPEEQGPATLNHEYACLARAIGRERTALLTGVFPPEEVRESGFPPEYLEGETRAAAMEGKILMPILQLNDPDLKASMAAVRRGGAQAIAFFLYEKRFLPYLPVLKEGRA